MQRVKINDPLNPGNAAEVCSVISVLKKQLKTKNV